MKRLTCILCAALLLTACNKSNIPFVYKIDIQQGNTLEPEKVAQVKVGMTQSQVAYLLGDPISHDSFKHDRWDYVYYNKPNRKPLEERHLTLYFDKSGKVERVANNNS